jgi:hypothetical protein
MFGSESGIAEAMLAGMSDGAKFDALCSLAIRVLESESDGASRVKELRKQLANAEQARNTAMHSVYVSTNFMGDGPRTLRQKVPKTGGKPVRTVEERVNLKAIDKTTRQIRAAMEEVVSVTVAASVLHPERTRGSDVFRPPDWYSSPGAPGGPDAR